MQRALGHKNQKRVSAALDRLIASKEILPEGYWPLREVSGDAWDQAMPTGFVAVVAPASGEVRAKIQRILSSHSNLGSWKFVSGSQADVDHMQMDYILVLQVLPNEPSLKNLYDDFQMLDGVTTHTFWLIG